MSETKQQFKHRKAYCSQNNDKIKVKCPICLEDTIPQKCKTFKNLSGLHWHIRRNHRGYVSSKFDENKILQVLNSLDLGMKWGIFPYE